MDLVSATEGINIVSRSMDEVQDYPEASVPVAYVVIYWRMRNSGESASAWIEGPTVSPVTSVEIPYTPELDKNVEIAPMPYSQNNTPRYSSIDDCFTDIGKTLIHQRETEAPIIGINAPATDTKIIIGISNFTRYARKRRIRIADNAEMEDALEIILDSSGYIERELPKYYVLTREVEGSEAIARTVQIELVGYNSGDEITIGDETYLFVDGDGTGNNIDISSGEMPTIAQNLADKINAATSTTYFTAAHAMFSTILTLTANTPGEAANSIDVMTHYTDDIIITSLEDGSEGSIVLPQANFVTIAHSSGTTFTPDSEVLEATFASGAGEGGSEGNFDPIPRDHTILS